jgi:hypothetical protein
MPTINVQLSVTGIYFGTPTSKNPKFTVPVTFSGVSPTVKNVMDAAVLAVKNNKYPNASMFSYGTNSSGAIQSISVSYTASPRRPSPFPVPGPGFYSLYETLNRPPFDTVLQYYHYRPTTVSGRPALIQLNIDAVPTLFNRPPTTPILNGDVIIWRLVTIETGPLSSVRGLQAASSSSEAILASMDAET